MRPVPVRHRFSSSSIASEAARSTACPCQIFSRSITMALGVAVSRGSAAMRSSAANRPSTPCGPRASRPSPRADRRARDP